MELRKLKSLLEYKFVEVEEEDEDKVGELKKEYGSEAIVLEPGKDELPKKTDAKVLIIKNNDKNKTQTEKMMKWAETQNFDKIIGVFNMSYFKMPRK